MVLVRVGKSDTVPVWQNLRVYPYPHSTLFTGDSSIGVRKGSANVMPSDSLADYLDDEDDQDVVADAEPDDATSGDIAALVEYMAELLLQT